MAQHLRGVDIVGQGFASGIQSLFQSLAQQYAEKQRRDQIQSLMSGLLSRQQPTMGYSQNMGAQAVDSNQQGTDIANLGGMNIPAERPQQLGNQFEIRPGVPMMSQQNTPQILELMGLDKNAWALIQGMQPKTQWIPGFRGELGIAQTSPSGQPSYQEIRPSMPEKQTNASLGSDWQDVLDAKGDAVTGVVNGVKTVKQFKYEVNPETQKVGKIYRNQKFDTTTGMGGGMPAFQLTPLDQGYAGYNRRTNQFVPIQGETQYKLTPTEVKTMAVNLKGNLTSIQAVKEILNRGKLTGPVVGTAKKIGTRFYNDKEAQALKNRLAQLRTVIYGLSGKQINESEQDWLKNEILPNMSNPSENFEVTLDEFEKWVNRRMSEVATQFPGMGKTQQTSAEDDPMGILK